VVGAEAAADGDAVTVGMSGRGIVIVLACVAMIAVGQVLFKAAAGQWRLQGWTWQTLLALLSPSLLVALAIYALATVLWVYALRTLPLSVAYPLFALTFVLVPLLAHYAHGEPLVARTFVGAGVIIVGVLISVL
jgi:drug/metabolite transporter (DMT)-like permease